MKIVEINLHPAGGKPAGKIFEAFDKYMAHALMGDIILVGISAALMAFAAVSRVPYENLKKEWEKMAPYRKQAEALKDEVAVLEDKRKKYEALFAPDIKLSRILAGIFGAIPENVWIQDLSFDGKTVKISGFVVKWREEYMASLYEFIRKLNGKNYFSSVFNKVNLKKSRRTRVSGREAIKFELECER